MHKNLRILFVEDSEDDAFLAINVLKAAGFDPFYKRVETLPDYHEALNSREWDLVLSDYSLPHFSGADALEIFKQKNLDIPFIILSGKIGEDIAVNALKSGANDYVMKNNFERLPLAVERALREAEQQRQRKSADLALRASEERYHLFFQQDLSGVFIASAQGKILLCNPAFMNMLGFAGIEEAKGANFFSLLTEKNASSVILKSLTEKEKFSLTETTLMSRSGKQVNVIENIIGTFDSNGELEQMTGYLIDITELKMYEAGIKKSLKEKEVMLKEIHHRVKNNLQIVSSLLKLQSRNLKDEGALEALVESQNRVRTMSLIHEKLYESKDISMIDFTEYMKSLTAQIVRMYGDKKIDTEINANGISLEIDTAIPCGLIVNEIVSNSLKHAFPDKKTGKIIIKMFSLDDFYDLTVSDNGIGFPENVDYKHTQTLGMQLVNTLCGQLRASFKLDRKSGTLIHIRFPKPAVPA